MYIAKYDKNYPYDENFIKLITEIIPERIKKNDDYFIFCTGVTGSGKTHLALHCEDLYMKEKADIKYIALKKEDFASALKEAKNSPQPRFCCYDEANVSKRDSLTKWNKDIIDLYFSIRGLGIFHWWNNPSVEMLDKALVREKINGLIFVATKNNDRPRTYYYFTKEKIMEMLEIYNILTIPLLKEKARRHASYVGCFKAYNGKLLKDYLIKKESRMEDKIEDFFNKYGENITKKFNLKISDIGNKIGVRDKKALRRYFNDLKEMNKIIENEHYVITVAGRTYFNESCLKLFEIMALEYNKKVTKHRFQPHIYNTNTTKMPEPT